jgi:hypothetical protein
MHVVAGETLSREEALARLEQHIGERCQFGLWAGPPPVRVEGGIEVPGEEVLWVDGKLDVIHRSPEADASPLYCIGGLSFSFLLPPLPGTISERDHGLDFELTDGLTLRLAWPGPSGHPP